MATQSETGTIAAWKDDRGFGFIRTASNNKEDDVFIHISSLEDITRRPRIGDVIHYNLAEENGKIKAIEASLEGAETVSAEPKKCNNVWIILATAIISSLTTLLVINYLPS